MTPYERVMAAIAGKDFDMHPVINPTSVVTLGCMKELGVYFPKAHTDPGEMAALAARGHEHFRFDSIMPYFSIHLEAAALGAKIDWKDANNTPQTIGKPIRNLDNFKLSDLCADENLNTDLNLNLNNNFLEQKYFQKLLRAISILRKKYGGKVPIIGKVIGPWTLAYNLYGVENMLLDIILEPGKVAALIKELSHVPIEFAKEQFNAGADIITWGEHVTSDLVSPQIYQDLVLPIHQKAALELESIGPIILHICGNVMDRLEAIKSTGFRLFHLHSHNDVPAALKAVSGKIQLVGGVNNPFTLTQSTPENVRKEVESYLEDGINIISAECAIPCNTPEQNLFALTKITHRYKCRGVANRH